MEATAAGGTDSTTLPPIAEIVPPAGPTTPPSSTETGSDALLPSALTVIVASPGARAEIKPLVTVTIDGAEELQLIGRSSASPATSWATAESWTVSPGTRSREFAETVTV